MLRRRRVFLCLTHDRRFAYVEWLLRVWIADLRGSRGEGLDRAESSRSVRPKVQRAGRPGADTPEFGCARQRG